MQEALHTNMLTVIIAQSSQLNITFKARLIVKKKL